MSNRFTKRPNWFTRVTRWRDAALKHRAAIRQPDRDAVKYYFRVARFIHCINAETISEMQVVRVPRDYSDWT